MQHGPELPYLREIAVFLAAAVLVVPLFQRLKASPVLGYLAVGVAIGPHGLGAIDDVYVLPSSVTGSVKTIVSGISPS